MGGTSWAKNHERQTRKKMSVIAVLACLPALATATVLASVLGACAGAPFHQKPEVDSTSATPMLPVELAGQGSKFFLQSCALCHGADARGDEGPDLHDLQMSDRHIVYVIKKGIKGEMPAFGEKYQDPEIAALLAYLRTLR
jgi:mono/diheme cytochrome c family protein